METETTKKEGEVQPVIPTIPNKLELSQEQRDEQLRTIEGKKLFLENFAKCRMIISLTCERINIDRSTFYDWYNLDAEFHKDVEAKRGNILNEVVDVLMGKILVEKDGASTRYFLDRKHPEFIPHSKTEVVTGTKTLDELLKDEDAKVEEEQKEYDNNKTTKENEPGTDRGTAVDTKQAGPDGAVQIQPRPELLLEKKDETKPNSESEAKGNQQGDRRRPAHRLRT